MSERVLNGEIIPLTLKEKEKILEILRRLLLSKHQLLPYLRKEIVSEMDLLLDNLDKIEG